MTTLDDIEYNELAIVARHQGDLSIWKAWKREIGAFTDPRMWRDTSCYNQYFQPLEGKDWDMAGYGVIVMDLDTKTAWSFNDYSSPWSFMLPNPSHFASNKKEKKWIEALLADTSSWKGIKLDVHSRTLIPGKGKRSTMTLEDLLPKGVSGEEALKLICSKDGDVKSNGTTYAMLGGRHLPQGWKVGCEIGQDGPEGLLDALTQWRDTGFPPPRNWEEMDRFMTKFEMPVSDKDIDQYMIGCENEDPECQEDMKQTHLTAIRYQQLKAHWTGIMGSPPARPKGP
jgi:hypothetical protein